MSERLIHPVLLSAVVLVLGLATPGFAVKITTPTAVGSTATTASLAAAPAETLTSDDSATTGPVVASPPKRGFGAPDWLVRGSQADNFTEDKSSPVKARPYKEAALSESPFTRQPQTYQPSGSLSGKVVYAMAGHGWTYDEDRQLYYTQRGITHGIIEDMGNLDQMHIFAHLCWNSGATVVPLRPVDHQPEERILDNTSAQTTFFGTWYPSSSDVYHGAPNDSTPYLFTTASTEETAIARYRPYLPVAGEYPVYTWARDGADRATAQLYRIAHAGGITNVRVNHRRVGRGYVWLGTFYFNQGDQGYVDVSNLVLDPYDADGSRVVVADGIRFGNGRGDVLRPAGRSGNLREDEGDSYWIERSLGPTADPRFYTASRDGAATISSPPRTAAFMNRENEGRYLDRILISFHTNALAGKSRGAVALFNQSAAQRPDHQELLAKYIGDQVNREMLADPPFASPRWAARERTTYNGINFGELRKDYLQNEMSATIVEAAFHDNEDDAKFLLDPRARVGMARATLRGYLKWLAHLQGPNAAIPMLPTPPEDPVIRSMAGGKLLVTWKAGVYGRIAGDPPTEYRVYRSRDGFSFDAGVMSEGESSMVIDPITSSGATFVRVTALNAGGESWPSQVVAAITPEIADALSAQTYTAKRLALGDDPASATLMTQAGTTTTAPARAPLALPSSRGKVLLVAGITSLDASTNQEQEIEDFSARPGNTISTWRVRPRTLLNAPRMDASADALTSAARVFDSCNSAAVANGRVPLREYETIVWVVGRQNPAQGILTSATQAMLREFLSGGGKLFISGAHLAQALDGPSPKVNPTQRNREFLQNTFGVRYEGANSEHRRVAGIPGGPFEHIPDLALSAGNALGMVDALPSDIIAATGEEAGEVLRYRTSGTATAAAAGNGFVFFAFPFENVETPDARAHLMHTVLQYLD